MNPLVNAALTVAEDLRGQVPSHEMKLIDLACAAHAKRMGVRNAEMVMELSDAVRDLLKTYEEQDGAEVQS